MGKRITMAEVNARMKRDNATKASRDKMVTDHMRKTPKSRGNWSLGSNANDELARSLGWI